MYSGLTKKVKLKPNTVLLLPSRCVLRKAFVDTILTCDADPHASALTAHAALHPSAHC